MGECSGPLAPLGVADISRMFERAGRAAKVTHFDIKVLWSIKADKLLVVRDAEGCAARAMVFWVEALLVAWLNTFNDRSGAAIFPSTTYVGANMVSPLTQGVPGMTCVNPEERMKSLRAKARRYYYAHPKTDAQRATANAYYKAWRQLNGDKESKRRREVYASRSDEQVAVDAAKKRTTTQRTDRRSSTRSTSITPTTKLQSSPSRRSRTRQTGPRSWRPGNESETSGRTDEGRRIR